MEKDKRFAGCDKDIDCLQKRLPSLVEVWNSKLVKNRSELMGGDWKSQLVYVWL